MQWNRSVFSFAVVGKTMARNNDAIHTLLINERAERRVSMKLWHKKYVYYGRIVESVAFCAWFDLPGEKISWLHQSLSEDHFQFTSFVSMSVNLQLNHFFMLILSRRLHMEHARYGLRCRSAKVAKSRAYSLMSFKFHTDQKMERERERIKGIETFIVFHSAWMIILKCDVNKGIYINQLLDYHLRDL